MLRTLVIFVCSIILLSILNWFDSRRNTFVKDSFKIHNKRKNLESFNDVDMSELHWLYKPVESNIDEDKFLNIPKLRDYETLATQKKNIDYPLVPKIQRNNEAKNTIKIKNKDVSIHNDAIFYKDVVFKGNDNDVKNVTFFDDVHVKGDIKMNDDVKLNADTLTKILNNQYKVNELFTKNYLVDPYTKNVKKIYPDQSMINDIINCDNSDDKECRNELAFKRKVVKEIVEVARDGKQVNSKNGLCKQLNCKNVLKKTPEKHACRAVFVNEQNEPLRTIDMRAEIDSDSVYYEKGVGNKNISEDHLISVNKQDEEMNYVKNDHLNTVILYKSNEDTQCELSLFKSEVNMQKYMNMTEKPVIKYPCKIEGNTKKADKVIDDLIKGYSPDKFTKEGNVDFIGNGMCFAQLHDINAIYLRVKNGEDK